MAYTPGGYAPGGVDYTKLKNVPGAPKKYPVPTGYAPGGVQYNVPPGPAPVFAPAVQTAPAVTTMRTVAGTPGKWNIPDYDALLAGDWEPNQAAIQGNQMRGDAQAGFQQQLRQAFIDFGGDQSKLGNFAQYIDNATLEAAKNNKFSQTAQNLASMTKYLRQSKSRNAARGMTSSGASTESARRAFEAREKSDYEAGRVFTGGAEAGLRGLSETEVKIANMIREAESRARARIAQENPRTWEEGTEDQVIEETVPGVPAAAAPAKPAAWGGVSWGGQSGIKTVAAMKAVLGPMGVSYTTWAKNHPDAAARLR